MTERLLTLYYPVLNYIMTYFEQKLKPETRTKCININLLVVLWIAPIWFWTRFWLPGNRYIAVCSSQLSHILHCKQQQPSYLKGYMPYYFFHHLWCPFARSFGLEMPAVPFFKLVSWLLNTWDVYIQYVNKLCSDRVAVLPNLGWKTAWSCRYCISPSCGHHDSSLCWHHWNSEGRLRNCGWP